MRAFRLQVGKLLEAACVSKAIEISVNAEALSTDPELSEPSEIVTVRSADVVFLPDARLQDVVAPRPALNRIDESPVDQNRAVYANESVGFELFGYARHGFTKQVRARLFLEQDVVTMRFGADQFRRIDKDDTPFVFDSDAVDCLRLQLDASQHIKQSRSTLLGRSPFGDIERLVNALGHKRL